VSTKSGPQPKTSAPTLAAQIERGFFPQLDGLRTIAFLLVLIHHLGPITSADPLHLPAHVQVLNTLSAWGGSGVDLFFCLSGFLISFILLNEKKQFGDISFKLFFVRRALRIWPVYYALLFAACVALPLSQWAHLDHKLYGEFLLKQALPMVLFIGNYSLIFATKVLFNFNTMVGMPIIYFLLPLWSLAVEEQFYLTWPFFLKKLSGPKAVLGTIGGIVVFTIVCRYVLWYISRYVWHLPFPLALYYETTPSHLDSLMAGAALSALTFFFPTRLAAAKKYSPLLMAGCFATVAALVTCFPDLKYNTYYNVAVFAVIALAGFFALAATLVSPTLTKIFAAKPLAAFGRLTYGMYLIHYFAIAMTDRYFAAGTNVFGQTVASLSPLNHWLLRFGTSLTGTVIFALLSWHILERHFQKMRKHFTRAARACENLDSEGAKTKAQVIA
jgi:peptidoglycan/LPS O-acetylase OafA/YrhL